MNTSNNGGWLRLDRSIFNSWAGEKPERFFRYADLLSLAAFEETTVYIRNNNIRLQRGELAVTTTFLARRWGISHQAVNNFLQQLISYNLLERRMCDEVVVYIIGNEHIELYRKNKAETNRCTDACKESSKTDCNTNTYTPIHYNTSDCKSSCNKAEQSVAAPVAQYKNKEKRINKSIINNKPKNDDWKRRRGQYTTARSWRDYDEPFV